MAESFLVQVVYNQTWCHSNHHNLASNWARETNIFLKEGAQLILARKIKLINLNIKVIVLIDRLTRLICSYDMHTYNIYVYIYIYIYIYRELPLAFQRSLLSTMKYRSSERNRSLSSLSPQQAVRHIASSRMQQLRGKVFNALPVWVAILVETEKNASLKGPRNIGSRAYMPARGS